MSEGIGQNPNNDQDGSHDAVVLHGPQGTVPLFAVRDELRAAGGKGGPAASSRRTSFQARVQKNGGRAWVHDVRVSNPVEDAERQACEPKPSDLVARKATVRPTGASRTALHTAGGASWAYDVMGRAGFTFQESGCWGKAVFLGSRQSSALEVGSRRASRRSQHCRCHLNTILPEEIASHGRDLQPAGSDGGADAPGAGRPGGR